MCVLTQICPYNITASCFYENLGSKMQNCIVCLFRFLGRDRTAQSATDSPPPSQIGRPTPSAAYKFGVYYVLWYMGTVLLFIAFNICGHVLRLNLL
jgi:hypothetical protein